ncbi:MAG: ankyrin repeat domain-containing protein [Candidatus Cardinium sp.]|uniref:ankyrin repeat domain-containing protein n=1 Tax=Cardinium endosymbiont of Dermatophagoides farinae TaxID=2597823 RepID=UPI001183984E|nr:ankyrin repeat domain-containing protein [Cardinium endosymbiont of Dermatophagoides farinae]TSJ80813.1 ankyrin repeat domain-containing protein [Cardinium endosymbiont of Dermatophagoides farinae]UWW96817.1 MAG: ankyrin repeat domain-containing protein [Candidatus Cardinium sp.]
MKKYFIVLLLIIASCNGLSKSTSNNMGQVHSNSQRLDKNKSKELGTTELDEINLETASCESLKAWYRKIASFALDQEKAYRDIKSFLGEGRLLFFDLVGKTTLTQEVLRQALEIWNRGGTLSSYCGNIQNVFNIENFIKIPDRIKFPMALDDFEERFPESFKQNNPTYVDQMDCLKMLLTQHADNEKIKERFYSLCSKVYKGSRIDSPFGIVVCLDDCPILKGFLDFIESKGIKISMNDKQIYTGSESNYQIRLCSQKSQRINDNTLSGQYWYEHSPITYVTQSGNVDILRLLIDRSKEVDNASLNLKEWLNMAANYGSLSILKLFIEKDESVDHHMIMHLIYNDHVSVVEELLNQGLIDQEKLIKKDDTVICDLQSVFIAAVRRYMSILTLTTFKNTPLSSPLKAELKLLKNLLIKILRNECINICEKDLKKGKIKLLYYAFTKSSQESPKYPEEFHNLILILSQHLDFEKIIDEQYYAYFAKSYLTIRKLVERCALPDIVALLESIKKPNIPKSNWPYR